MRPADVPLMRLPRRKMPGARPISASRTSRAYGPASAAASLGTTRIGARMPCSSRSSRRTRRVSSATSPQRQAAFAARIAMQNGSPDADARYGAVIGTVTSDAGLLMDRALPPVEGL